MLHRTLLAFAGFVALALLLTVGYALTGLAGPDSAIDEARAALEGDRPEEAVRILALAEKSMGPTGRPELRRQLLELRADAYLAEDKDSMALGDLKLLAEVYAPGDRGVEMKLLRVLIAANQADLAITRAEQWLDKHEEDPRALELAGEATQSLFLQDLAALSDELARLLPQDAHSEAMSALERHLYRRRDGPFAWRAKGDFDAVLREHVRGAAVAGKYEPMIRSVRRTITRTQTYFRRSMKAGGQPVAAYQGLATILRKSGRTDDAVALAEIYMRKFDHAYRDHAAVEAARVHFAADREAAALDTVDRALSRPSWEEAVAAGIEAGDIQQLLMLKARILHQRRDAVALEEVVTQMHDMAAAGLDLEPIDALIEAYQRDASDDAAGVQELMRPFCRLLLLRQELLADNWSELLQEGMQLQLRAARLAGARTWQIRDLCELWLEGQPTNPLPHIEHAKALVSGRNAEAALRSARRALTRFSRNEDALRIYARAADRALAQSGRGAEALLQQCLDRREELPHGVADDALYLELAQRALDGGHRQVAVTAARRASQLYPWARWPRLVCAEAALRLGQVDLAVRTLEDMRRNHPDDAEGLAWLIRAREAANIGANDLLFDLARDEEPQREVAIALLQNSLRRGDAVQARDFAQQVVRTFAGDAEVLVLAADAMRASGDRVAARKLLLPAFRAIFKDPTKPAMAATAARRFLELEADAGHGNDQEQTVARLAKEALLLHMGEPTALLEMAEYLLQRGFAEPAYELANIILTDPRHAPVRSGRHQEVAGRAALAAGDHPAALQHFQAALAFEDGQQAWRPLALLLLSQQRDEEATDVVWVEEPESVAGAALMIRLDRGGRSDAYVAETLERDPSDFAGHCLHALRAPETAPIPGLREIAEQAPGLLAEVVAYTAEPGFAELAVTHAEELRERFPEQNASPILWARALVAAERFDEALRLLRPLANAGSITANDELVRTLELTDPRQIRHRNLVERISGLVRSNATVASPRLRAVALRGLADEQIRQGGSMAAAAETLTMLWLALAPQADPGLFECTSLLRFGKPQQALKLLDLVESRVPPEERDEFVAAFGKSARAMSTSCDHDPAVLRDLRARAQQMRKQDGAFGSIVHFLLWDDARRKRLKDPDRLKDPSDAPDPDASERERRLLNAHLAMFQTGRDRDVDFVIMTLNRLLVLDGRREALLRSDELLRADPSLVPVWLTRARYLEYDERVHEAAASLRWLLDYVDDEQVLLEYARLAGVSGEVAADDEALLQRLDEDTAESPRGRFVRGLIALRNAKYPEAAELLDNVAPRRDGAHVYYRGLALLPLPGDAASEAAAALFAEMAEKHPRTGISRMPGDFALQLTVAEP
ncbi:MAG: hypothetical protein AAF628_34675 [Planctomycetota bacterium]